MMGVTSLSTLNTVLRFSYANLCYFFLFIIVFNCLVDCILALKVIIQLCKPILCNVVEFVCPNNL